MAGTRAEEAAVEVGEGVCEVAGEVGVLLVRADDIGSGGEREWRGGGGESGGRCRWRGHDEARWCFWALVAPDGGGVLWSFGECKTWTI